ncbi:MAG: cell wall-binding repeat-containing protein [Clostridiales bacterium]|nr:cell wall-binding repeat-containing protein [Candidatus Crickella merdequi]
MKASIKNIIIMTTLILIMESVSVVAFAERTNPSEYGLFKPQGDEFIISEHMEDSSSAGFKKAGLPEKYDSRKLTYASSIKVKNQKTTGLCWTFAATTAAERSWQEERKREGCEPVVVELSPMHLGYFVYHKEPDVFGNNFGDENLIVRNSYNWKSIGGNSKMVLQTLAQGVGFEEEQEVPFNESTTYLEPSLCNSSKYSLENGNYLYSEEDLKQAIMKYGAVAADYYSEDLYLASDKRSYYCNISKNSNHAIVIVGWDDSYNANNFIGSDSGIPEKDGAWIIQNSWGASVGDSGYYYISYEDSTLCDPCYFDVQPGDTYDYIYQYDGNCTDASIVIKKGQKLVNFYVSEGSQKEILKAVGFINANKSAETFYYTVEIYKSAFSTSDINETNKVACFNITTTGEGYNTFELPEETAVELKKGTGFAVSITYTGSDGGSGQANIGYENNDNSNGYVNYKASNDAGRSFWYYGSWYDLGAKNNSCARIKALTIAADNDNYDDTKESLFKGEKVKRTYGLSRYETSKLLADDILTLREGAKFDCVVLASGRDYPDALSGGYLATINNAPLILVDESQKQSVCTYLSNSLNKGGKIYILGGEYSISKSFENTLREKITSNIQRCEGRTRYDTNLAVLEAAKVNDEDLLICSGLGFADALSATATNKPILLVGASLTDSQKVFLQSNESKNGYVIGGTASVSETTKGQIKSIRGDLNLERIYGQNRYETSLRIAEYFFGDKDIDTVVVSYGKNFPDGLSGGPVAIKLEAPLILAETAVTSHVESFTKKKKIKQILVIGGPTYISAAAANKIIN